MKKILLITVIACAVLTAGVFAAFSATALFGKSLKGSGNLVTKTMTAPAFDGIDASRAVKVVVANTDKITIEADDNLIDHVVVKVEDGELEVGISDGLKNISNIHVTVTVPNNGNIRSLDASSAASITTDVALLADEFKMSASSGAKIAASVKAGKCEIDASSGAKIKAAVIATKCTLDASSAGKIELAGSAKECEASLSSGASINAEEFAVETYDISASSGSHAKINCTKVLTAGASSGADIDYTGDCSTQISKSSGGSVSKK